MQQSRYSYPANMRVADGQSRHDVSARTRLRIMHDQDLYSKGTFVMHHLNP